MDTSSLMLALQLQHQDLSIWEQSKKGKQREGEVADSDLALEACRHELEMMTAQISDQVMALSIARAVESDGQLIREAQLAEEQAAKDREYAVRLARDPSAATRSDAEKEMRVSRVDEEEDNLIDTLRSMNLGGFEYSTSGQPESSGWASSRKPPQTQECIACNDRFPPLALSKAPCSHDYCRECLVSLTRASLQNETLFPPRCCGQNIPIEQGRWFSPELVGQFQAKKLEFETPNRTYCSEPSCSTFVPPAFVSGDSATCPKCSRKTCTHSCRCSAEFCYVCGKKWRSCRCPLWEEGRLVRRANAIANRDELGTTVVAVTDARNAATSFLTISSSALSAMSWPAGDVDITAFEKPVLQACVI
ncbi:hypothetical protein BFJ72_g12113 [Fusarium proliferatum]|uniref:RING-type domain-containing protein n=1 Tax=Gibberella intermedia TaxID=948311 RepID=A0A420SIX8_GIBIN|nr:hypothetical protein BFJ72_g12113 [Fusarium proliferatum]